MFFSVQEWMNHVKLKLILDKTEFIIIGSKHTKESLKSNFPVTFFQSSIVQAVKVKKNVGVTFNSKKTFDNHIAKV